MKKFFVLLSVCLFYFPLKGQELTKKDLKYKPINLEDAVRHMHKLTDGSTEIWIKNIHEQEYVSNEQFSQGIWIRNNWRLWRGGELAQFFNSRGILHPDDMSYIIFVTFHRDVNSQQWKTDELITGIIEEHLKQEEHERKMQTDSVYRKQVELENEEELRISYDELKRKYSTGKEVYTFLIYNCFNNNKVKVYGTVIEHREKGVKLFINRYEESKRSEGAKKCNEIIENTIWVDLMGVCFLDEKPRPLFFRATPY